MELSTISIGTKDEIFLVQSRDLQYFYFTKKTTLVKLKSGESIHLDHSWVNKYQNFYHPYFFKIHPNYIVNIKFISHLIKKDSEWLVVMMDLCELPIDDANWRIFQERFLIF